MKPKKETVVIKCERVPLTKELMKQIAARGKRDKSKTKIIKI